MKQTILLFAALSVAGLATAQITLNQSSYAAWTPRVDTLGIIATGLPSLSANATSDLSAAIYASPYQTSTTFSATNAAYASATFANTITDGLPSTTNAGIGWITNLYKGITSTGIITYGEATTRQAYSIAATTSNTADSIVVPAQNIVYSTPRTGLKFPATMGTVWTNNFKYTVNIIVTVTSYSLINTPFSRVSYCTETDSVLGWGKMKVKQMTGVASGNMDFIAVKRKTQYIDSILMNGTPAPIALLTAFGLSQAGVTDIYNISWYRAGEVTPLLTANYTSSSYTTATGGAVHLNRLAFPAGIADFTVAGEEVLLYPSVLPAGSAIALEVKNATAGKWSYALVNSAGQVIAQNTMAQAAGNKFLVSTPAGVAAGTYYIALSKDGMPVAVKPLTLQ